MTDGPLSMRRVVCGMTALLLPMCLALPWTDPPYSTGEAEWYTGWALFAAGLGSEDAPHACGEETCSRSELFVAAGMPTLATLLAAAALAVVCYRHSSAAGRVAVGLVILALLGAAGEWAFLSAAAENTSFPDQFNLRSGMLATVLTLAAGGVAAGASVRSQADG